MMSSTPPVVPGPVLVPDTAPTDDGTASVVDSAAEAAKETHVGNPEADGSCTKDSAHNLSTESGAAAAGPLANLPNVPTDDDAEHVPALRETGSTNLRDVLTMLRDDDEDDKGEFCGDEPDNCGGHEDVTAPPEATVGDEFMSDAFHDGNQPDNTKDKCDANATDDSAGASMPITEAPKVNLPVGVRKLESGRYQAQVSYGGVRRSVGTFPTAREAAEARESAEMELCKRFGQFFTRNVPKEQLVAAFDAIYAIAGSAPPQELPRGITMRHSGTWQVQMFYRGKSRYVGVFGSVDDASKVYEALRNELKDNDGDGVVDTGGAKAFDSKSIFDAARERAMAAVGQNVAATDEEGESDDECKAKDTDNDATAKPTSARLVAVGVHKMPSGKYKAQLSVCGSCRAIGRFSTADEAVRAREAVKAELQKRFPQGSRGRTPRGNDDDERKAAFEAARAKVVDSMKDKNNDPCKVDQDKEEKKGEESGILYVSFGTSIPGQPDYFPIKLSDCLPCACTGGKSSAPIANVDDPLVVANGPSPTKGTPNKEFSAGKQPEAFVTPSPPEAKRRKTSDTLDAALIAADTDDDSLKGHAASCYMFLSSLHNVIGRNTNNCKWLGSSFRSSCFWVDDMDLFAEATLSQLPYWDDLRQDYGSFKNFATEHGFGVREVQLGNKLRTIFDNPHFVRILPENIRRIFDDENPDKEGVAKTSTAIESVGGTISSYLPSAERHTHHLSAQFLLSLHASIPASGDFCSWTGSGSSVYIYGLKRFEESVLSRLLYWRELGPYYGGFENFANEHGFDVRHDSLGNHVVVEHPCFIRDFPELICRKFGGASNTSSFTPAPTGGPPPRFVPVMAQYQPPYVRQYPWHPAPPRYHHPH